jgi:hypothetical protein
MSKFLLLLRTDTVVQLAMRLLFSNKCIGQIDNDIAHRTPCTFHTTIVHRGINRKGVPIEIGILVVVRLDDWIPTYVRRPRVLPEVAIFYPWAG